MAGKKEAINKSLISNYLTSKKVLNTRYYSLICFSTNKRNCDALHNDKCLFKNRGIFLFIDIKHVKKIFYIFNISDLEYF